MHENIILISSIGLLLLSCLINFYSLYRFRHIIKLKSEITVDNQPLNLEEIILAIKNNIKIHDQKHKKTEEQLFRIDDHLKKTYQKIAINRYNAFGDEGGNLSFSLVILNGHNTGILMTSMHGREQNRVYTKHILQGQSEQALSQEEIQALTQAIKQ